MNKKFTVMCICCGAPEGEVGENCNIQNFRKSEPVDLGDYHNTKYVYPLDVETFFKSSEFKGYLMYPPSNPPSDAFRQQLLDKINKEGLSNFFYATDEVPKDSIDRFEAELVSNVLSNT